METLLFKGTTLVQFVKKTGNYIKAIHKDKIINAPAHLFEPVKVISDQQQQSEPEQETKTLWGYKVALH